LKLQIAFFKITAMKRLPKRKDWGMREPGVSSRAAYADMDNDDDLNLVIKKRFTCAGSIRPVHAMTSLDAIRMGKKISCLPE
jgi:hypothetical protein